MISDWYTAGHENNPEAESYSKYTLNHISISHTDPKLSDSGVRRGTCMVGGKAAAEAGAVTHGAVRCSAWLGASFI